MQTDDRYSSDENLRYQHHEHHDYISDYEYHIDDDDRNEQLDYDSSVARHLGIDPKWLGAWESYCASLRLTAHSPRS